MSRYDIFSFSNMKRRSIENRKSKVHLEHMAKPPEPGSLRTFAESLPDVLKARDLIALADYMEDVRKRGAKTLVMFGGHVIKCGLGPILIDLMERGYISGIATNGSIAIHDSELALFGETSETVENEIDDGLFGMTEETADFLNTCQKRAAKEDLGFGEAIGEALSDAPNRDISVIYNAYRLGIPHTIHPMPGAEVIHPHPTWDGAALGRAAETDFRILTQVVTKLSGGLVMNIGSAVIMPELFIKALSAARNIGHDVSNFSAANFDMIQHYRPTVNILRRPTQLGGSSWSFTGHHEIMVPLLAGVVR